MGIWGAWQNSSYHLVKSRVVRFPRRSDRAISAWADRSLAASARSFSTILRYACPQTLRPTPTHSHRGHQLPNHQSYGASFTWCAKRWLIPTQQPIVDRLQLGHRDGYGHQEWPAMVSRRRHRGTFAMVAPSTSGSFPRARPTQALAETPDTEEEEEDNGLGEKGRMQPRRHPSLLHHHRAGEMVVVVLPSLPSLRVPSPAMRPSLRTGSPVAKTSLSFPDAEDALLFLTTEAASPADCLPPPFPACRPPPLPPKLAGHLSPSRRPPPPPSQSWWQEAKKREEETNMWAPLFLN